ncbi:MAG: response regulator transcription factor [Thermoleophilaceae bacterium]
MAGITRCVAVDDHPAVREGLARLLGGADGIELVASIGRGEDAIDAIDQHAPDVVIVDLRLPGMDGISLLRAIAEHAPDVEKIAYSAYGDRGLLCDAIAAGVRGYVMKGSPPDDLIRAIETVSQGEAFVDPSLSPTLLMSQGRTGTPLSEREREILQLLAEGLHTEEVAGRISLSAGTVKNDLGRAIEKLEAGGRVQAVAIALRRALIA